MNELHEEIKGFWKNAPNHETALEQILRMVLAKFNSETGKGVAGRASRC